MITPAYAQTLAAYNAEMNRRWYAAAAGLSEDARTADRGAFWGSVHGTLAHILWADRMWMSRFAGWDKPAIAQKQSPALFDDFAAMRAARVVDDARIIAWAEGVTQAWLDQDQVWFSGSVGREMRQPRGLLVTHMFNHQTHHRGQAHALLTALGQSTGDTDLPFVL
jgi:uncharacterized damage-inducible protein DinB